jgi:NlpC/P60 family protein
MGRRLTFVALYLTMASGALGQSAGPASVRTPGPRPVTKTEGRNILAAISTVDTDSDSETDCSHLVHDVYERAGFAYDYASSRELYIGSTNFTRVKTPQAGDLVVWRGHVGIVIDPKEHSFFSFVRSGPDTQFYDSPYWRSRGIARFYRYMTEKPLRSGRTLEATRRADRAPLSGANRSSENRPPSALPTSKGESNSISEMDPSSSGINQIPREIVLQVAGKNPAADEVLSAFVEMNQDSGKSLRRRGLNNLERPIIVYRDLRAYGVQIKGKHGTAVVRIESLGGFPNTETGSQPGWRELSLEFEKTKRGWVMSPVQETVYISREVALQALSGRLAELAQNADVTAEREREQKQIIRFLNLLVPDDSKAVSAETR